MPNVPSSCRPFFVLALLSGPAVPGTALGQEASALSARSFWDEAQALARACHTNGKMRKGCDWASICPKFLEGYKRSPEKSRLMRVAQCYRDAGKHATAWGLYEQYASPLRASIRALNTEHKTDDDDRRLAENLARDAQNELKPIESAANAEKALCSFVSMSVPVEVASIPGLKISLDGLPMTRATWNGEHPVDGGTHQVLAEAPGRDAWHQTFHLGDNSDRIAISVPVLQLRQPPPLGGYERPWGVYEWTGLASGAGGLAALGASAYFLWGALSRKKESETDCTGDYCGPRGLILRDEAVARGSVATGFAAPGLAMLATGAVLFIWGRVRPAREQPTHVGLDISIEHQQGFVNVERRF